MSRAHVRRTIHDKRESFRLRERERGRVFLEKGEKGQMIWQIAREMSHRGSCLVCLLFGCFSFSCSQPLYIRVCMYVCMYSRSSNYTCPVIWIGLSNCVQPWPRTNSYLACKQTRVHSIYVTYPPSCLEFVLIYPGARERTRRVLSCLLYSSRTVSPTRCDFWTKRTCWRIN